MRILLLTQIVPYPPDSGPKIKTYHVLRYLAAHGHRVVLASFVRDHEKPHLDHLRRYCEEIYPIALHRSRIADAVAYATSLWSGLPFLVARDSQIEMQQLIERLAQREFDIVHADQLTMAQYALQFRRANPQSAAIVFDAHNAVYEIVARAQQTAFPLLRPVLALEARRLKQYEGKLVEQFDRTLAVSAIDKHVLLRAHTDKLNDVAIQDKIAVIPIAVDCTSLQPIKRTAESHNIMTMGTLFYPPNADGVRWFMHQVYPLVKKQVADTTFTIVGPRPPQDILEFGKQNASYIQVAGYVPDLQPYFERAALMVVPVRVGSGMRVRILETLARGIPTVTTTIGAEGIEAQNGTHLLIADEPADFAQAVVRLLINPQLGHTLAQNGRRLAEKKYDWRVVLPQLEAVYQSLKTI